MDKALELIDLIYDSVADASQWQVFVDRFAKATRAKQATLSIGDPRWDEFAFVYRYGMSELDVREYLEHLEDDDPWLTAAGGLAEGLTAPSHELWAEQDMVKTAMYREFMAPRDWYYGMGGIVLVTNTSRSVISILRGKSEGPCLSDDLSLLIHLMPHLRRAALLHSELSSLRSQRAAFTDHLDRYPQAFVLTDARARVLFSNTAANKIISLRDGLKVEAGRLVALSSREDAALQEAIRETAVASTSSPSRMPITRSSRALPYRLLLMPLQGSRAVPLGVSQPAVAVLIVDSGATSCPSVAMLQELFSLTPCEARVAASLVQGQSVEEAAAKLNVSVETVRTHVRRVLSKTDTNRQGELIALVLRTVPFNLP